MTILLEGPNRYIKVKNASKKVLHMIKFMVPINHRYYEDGFWYVHSDYVAAVTSAVAQEGHVAHIEARGIDLANAFKNMNLLETAPLWLVEAAWKAYIRNLHPDVGGDQERFLLVKESYELITRKLG